MIKIYEQKTAPNGVKFKIQQTGLNWTLYFKEYGKSKWEKIQSSVDAKFLYQVMMNQKDFTEFNKYNDAVDEENMSGGD